MNRAQRPVRIANASGFFGDRQSAFRDMVDGGEIDVITGDYLAEVTMTVLAKQRAKNPALGYAASFLGQIEPVLGRILERGIQVVVNAGGLHPRGLAEAVRALGAKLGLAPQVALIEGDDLVARLAELRADNAGFPSNESGEPLPITPGFVTTANAYLGAWGIVRALEAGADIVICPRVTDASLVVGAAAAWHGWARTDWDRLAGAVAAGHVIECGPQATGGNYSGFEAIGDLSRPGFPIAEIAADGSSVITKHPGTGGSVTVSTVTAQLVYEIGGPAYANPDVITHLSTVALAQTGPDRVTLSGATGSPPPPTTKVAITCRGRFRNELTFAFVGLAIDTKIALFERTTRAALAKRAIELSFQRIGAAPADPVSQNEATVLLRVIAESEDEALVSRAFSAALVEQGLSSYPGLFAAGLPGGAQEATGYWPTLVRQHDLQVHVTLPDGTTEEVPPPPETRDLPVPTLSAEAASEASSVEDTDRGPLGLLVDARSGDKGSDANVGLWVRDPAGYPWLLRTLTVERFRELLPEARDLVVERYPLPNLYAVNFVVRGLLAGGAIASLRFDRQAKALGEFLRARHVDLPRRLLAQVALNR